MTAACLLMGHPPMRHAPVHTKFAMKLRNQCGLIIFKKGFAEASLYCLMHK
jgi:hypothetical protein